MKPGGWASSGLEGSRKYDNRVRAREHNSAGGELDR